VTVAKASGRPWAVVAGSFFCLWVVAGASYSYAAFAGAMAASYGTGRMELGLAFGLCGSLTFLAAPAGGLLADRFGPGRTCAAGIACIAAGLWGTSLAPTVEIACASYGLGVGLGSALAMTPAIACVPAWFTHGRGTASAIASSGVAVGTLAIPPLVAGAVHMFGWQDAVSGLALVALVFGLPASGLLSRASLPAEPAVATSGLRQALWRADFWWLYGALLLVGPALIIPFGHLALAAHDLGEGPGRAVSLVSMAGASGLAGRLLFGKLADWTGCTEALALSLACTGAAYLLWWSAWAYGGLAAFAILFGMAYGGVVALLPAVCADRFGGASAASVLGALYTAAAPGYLLGPVLAGHAHDAGDGYGRVAGACLALGLTASLTMLLAGNAGSRQISRLTDTIRGFAQIGWSFINPSFVCPQFAAGIKRRSQLQRLRRKFWSKK